MSDTAKVYRSFHGFVKFEPRDGEAAGKAIRSIVVRNIGVKDQAIDVRATLWPSHEHVDVAQGDLVTLEGEFKVNKTADKEGKPMTYFNLSVSNIVVLGSGDGGSREQTVNGGANDADLTPDDDDLPY